MNGEIENSAKPTDDDDNEMVNGVETPELKPEPNKRRRKKSEVWQYFTPQPISPGCVRAFCNQCKRSFAYTSGNKHSGTSHLKRHISMGSCPVNRFNKEKEKPVSYGLNSQNGAITARPRKRCRASPESVSIALDQERCTHELARMIIMHEFQTNLVEQAGFVDFARALQPHFSVMSSDSVQNEIVTIYRREKHSLKSILAEIPGRVSLTVDLWTSDQTVGYAILTGHFIDADWKLQRRVLNFAMVPFPESQVAFNPSIVTCLSEWDLENRLFALTIDQSFANEEVVGNLKGLLSINNSHMLKGEFVMVNCYARVISRLAQDAIMAMSQPVGKVRDSVKFVKASASREEKFNLISQQLQVPSTKVLVIDNRGNWDSTYHMLSTACELKEVFSCLDTSDPDYNLAPSMDDWKCIEGLCFYLKLFFDAADILTTETYPVANKFFHEVYKIQFELTQGAFSDNPSRSKFVRPLYEEFDKYWRDCCVVLAMAVAMDPRYKLKVAEFSFTKLYGNEGAVWARTVDDRLHNLFLDYYAQTVTIYMDQKYEGFIKADPLLDEVSLPPIDGLQDFDIYVGVNSEHEKSELDQYLDEALMPREELDVVDWWKLNRIKYPTLSKMAADILSIPFGTVFRDSVFDTASRKLDSYRASLKPSILEAIICSNDWLCNDGMEQNSSVFDMIPAMTLKIEKQ